MIEQNDEKELVAVAVEKGVSVADMLSKFSTAGRAGSTAAQTEKQNEASAIAVPLITEAKSLQTRHGLLKSKYLAKAESVHHADWLSIFKSVPQGLEMAAAGQRLVPKNHDALRRLQQAAADTVSNLTSTFGDSSPGNDDLNAYSLANAATTMESILKFSAHDPLYDGTTSAAFRRAVKQLTWWLDKSRAIVASTEDAVERFLRYEAEARELLADITPQDGVASKEKVYIPKLPSPPTPAGGSSYTDFDPRSPAQQKQPEGVEVTSVGDRDGFRVNATKGRR